MSVHPRSAAASLAPLYTTLQKLPLSPWVISANLYDEQGFPLAAMFTALVVVPLLLALLLELLLPHAATSRAATPTAATIPIVRDSRLID